MIITFLIFFLYGFNSSLTDNVFDDKFKPEAQYVETKHINNYLNKLRQFGIEFEVIDETRKITMHGIIPLFGNNTVTIKIPSINTPVIITDNLTDDEHASISIIVDYYSKNDPYTVANLLINSAKILYPQYDNSDSKIIYNIINSDFQEYEQGYEMTTDKYYRDKFIDINRTDSMLLEKYSGNPNYYLLKVIDSNYTIERNYKKINYEDILNSEDLMETEDIEVTGTITEYKETNMNASGTLTTEDGYDYNFWIGHLPDVYLSKGDMINVRGMLLYNNFNQSKPNIRVEERIKILQLNN